MDIEPLLISNIQQFINEHKILSSLLIVSSAIFHFKYFIILLLLLYIYNKITKKQLVILFIAQIIIGSIKYSIKRLRPFNKYNYISNLDPLRIDKYSFPSGHMTSAFLLAYFLNKNIGTLNFYILPILVGLSRVYLGVHYPTDLLGGIILAGLIIHFSKE